MLNKIAIWLVLVSATFGCSLMNLGEFEEGDSKGTDNSYCLDYNEQKGKDITQDCDIYQLDPGSGFCYLSKADWDSDGYLSPACKDELEDGQVLDCDDSDERRYPGAPERLDGGIGDGIDNNCDDIIDNGAIEASTRHLIQIDAQNLENVYYAFGPDGGLEYVSNENDHTTAHLGTLRSDGVPKVTDVSYPSGKCYQKNMDTKSIQQEDCVFAEVVGDRLQSGDWFVSAINTKGCTDGQIRIGLVLDTSDTSTTFWEGDTELHSNISYGMETVDGRGCVATLADSTQVTRVSLAALEPVAPQERLPQALVAWMGDSLERRPRECCDESSCGVADVEVLGVWLEQGWLEQYGEKKWATATNNGSPQPLSDALPQESKGMGRTRGAGRPALVARARSKSEDDIPEGYYLAHGNISGSVSLYFLPSFKDPEPTTLEQMLFVSAERTTPALNLSAEMVLGTVKGVFGTPDHVALALGPYDSATKEQRLGVVWQEGCGTGKEAVLFSEVTFSAADPIHNPSGHFEATKVVRIDIPSGFKVQPGAAVIYVDADFVTPNFTRNKLNAGEHSRGGWLLSWVEKSDQEGSRLRVARVLEMDQGVIKTGIQDDIATVESTGDIAYPSLYAIDRHTRSGLVSLTYYERGKGEFWERELIARAPEAE